MKRLIAILLFAFSSAYAAAPTLVSYTETVFNTTTSPKTSASISWNAGDLIVVIGGSEGSLGSLATPTGTGLSFTDSRKNTAASTCGTIVSTATPASSGSSTISMTESGGQDFGFGVWVFRDSAGFGGSAEQHTTSKTVSYTAAGTNSAIVWASFDFSVETLGTLTPTPSNTRHSESVASHYTILVGDLLDQTSGGAVSYGVTGGGSSGPFSIVLKEIKAGSGSAAAGFNKKRKLMKYMED